MALYARLCYGMLWYGVFMIHVKSSFAFLMLCWRIQKFGTGQRQREGDLSGSNGHLAGCDVTYLGQVSKPGIDFLSFSD